MKNQHRIGTEFFSDSMSPQGGFATVFEDDGETGYFYALDTKSVNQQIVSALHVYDVASEGNGTQVLLETIWTSDGLMCGFLIDHTVVAVFDFGDKSGWQRLPISDSHGEWTYLPLTPDVESSFLKATS
jgi:hypothetical protein